MAIKISYSNGSFYDNLLRLFKALSFLIFIYTLVLPKLKRQQSLLFFSFSLSLSLSDKENATSYSPRLHRNIES